MSELDDEVLLLNKRNHDAKEFYRTYERVRKVGIENVNVDLMSGMVGQSKDSFLRTVNEMIALRTGKYLQFTKWSCF